MIKALIFVVGLLVGAKAAKANRKAGAVTITKA